MFISIYALYNNEKLLIERGPDGKIHIWYANSIVHHVLDDAEATDLIYGLSAVLAPTSKFIESVTA